MPATHHTAPRNAAALQTLKEKLLTTAETADLLNIGKRTLQERMEARAIGFVKIGRSIRFSQSDIETFIESNHVKPQGWKINRGGQAL